MARKGSNGSRARMPEGSLGRDKCPYNLTQLVPRRRTSIRRRLPATGLVRQGTVSHSSCRGGRRTGASCRVGPGNFTPSPSQIRTGYSRIIRLVPPREGCRLPLKKGLFPASRLTQINGDDLPPSLHGHYSRFSTTTRQSVPLRRIGTFGLAVGAACPHRVLHRFSPLRKVP